MSTFQISPKEQSILKSSLNSAGFEFKIVPYSFWQAKKDKTTATFYTSGKFLLQSNDEENFYNEFLKVFFAADKKIFPRIGTDESGKGDYFGPLIICGVCIENERQEELLIKAGVRDSKDLNEKKIYELSDLIRANVHGSIIKIHPEKYNELIEKMPNLNSLMGWGHAKAIENILEKINCEYALSDKFGKDEYIVNALLEKGKKIRLEQKTKAESDTAVAAASIMARAEFLKAMKALSEKYSMSIPRGAGPAVLIARDDFLKKYGEAEMRNAVKLHFKMGKT